MLKSGKITSKLLLKFGLQPTTSSRQSTLIQRHAQMNFSHAIKTVYTCWMQNKNNAQNSVNLNQSYPIVAKY
jgi:hypothetical protein